MVPNTKLNLRSKVTDLRWWKPMDDINWAKQIACMKAIGTGLKKGAGKAMETVLERTGVCTSICGAAAVAVDAMGLGPEDIIADGAAVAIGADCEDVCLTVMSEQS